MTHILFLIAVLAVFVLTNRSLSRKPVAIKHYNLEGKPIFRVDEIVNRLLEESELSALKINALLYLVYVWGLVYLGRRIIPGKFVAYNEGPMIREVRETLKYEDDFVFPKRERSETEYQSGMIFRTVIPLLVESYKHQSGTEMMNKIKHGKPWITARKSQNKILKNQEMINYYKIDQKKSRGI